VSDNFPIQNGVKERGALLPLLFRFAIEYAIMGERGSADG
jgi:hypothetical protein